MSKKDEDKRWSSGDGAGCNPLRALGADEIRTYVVGKASRRRKEVYRDVLELQDHLLARIRPGMPIGELFAYAMQHVKSLGYESYFQGYGKSQGRYIGHGVGLELDEWPVLDGRARYRIQEGVVLAVECKFIIPDFGAVFIEDTVVVRSQGIEILSGSDRSLAEITTW